MERFLQHNHIYQHNADDILWLFHIAVGGYGESNNQPPHAGMNIIWQMLNPNSHPYALGAYLLQISRKFDLSNYHAIKKFDTVLDVES